MFKKIIFWKSLATLTTLCILFGGVSLFAAPPRDINYGHALSRAVNRNPSISPLDREARQAFALADRMREERTAIVNYDRDAADALYGQMLIATAQGNILRREREQAMANVELALRRHLANIAENEERTFLLEGNITLMELMMEQTELRHQHGMASEVELRELTHNLDQVRLQLEMLSLAQQNERQELNRLINWQITANIRLVYSTEVEPIPELDDRGIRRLAAMCHSYLGWEDVAVARRYEWQRQLDDPEVDNAYGRLQTRLAVIERDLAERQAETNVRAILAEWEQLIEEEAAIQADIEQAQEALETVISRLEAGMAIPIEVFSAELAVAAEEARMSRLAYDFWILRLQVDHPYIRSRVSPSMRP